MLYGLYRAIGKPGMSVVLTVISLGTRVGLAYGLSAVLPWGLWESGGQYPLAGCWPTVWGQAIIFSGYAPEAGCQAPFYRGKRANKKTVKKRKKVLDNFDLPWYYITCELRSSLVTSGRKWRNWQTRRLQVLWSLRSCGFKSHLPHKKISEQSEIFFFSLRARIQYFSGFQDRIRRNASGKIPTRT